MKRRELAKDLWFELNTDPEGVPDKGDIKDIITAFKEVAKSRDKKIIDLLEKHCVWYPRVIQCGSCKACVIKKQFKRSRKKNR